VPAESNVPWRTLNSSMKKMNPMGFFFKAYQAGVHVFPGGPDTVRAMASLEANREDVLGAVEVLREVMAV